MYSLSSVLSSWWMDSRDALPGTLRRAFDSVLLLVSWRIWKERNARVFDGVSSSAAQLTRSVLVEADEWIAAGFTAIAELLVTPA